MTEIEQKHTGGCLCEHIRFEARGTPSFPHLCSCRMCQKWSGAPTVAWVEFPLAEFSWTGVGGEPALHPSSKKTLRGFCPKCGSTICALDAGYENISLTITMFDDHSLLVPDVQHSFKDMVPKWWHTEVIQKTK